MALNTMTLFEKYRQPIRYAAVGVAQNFLGYLLYLLLTWLGLGPKITISILYPIGFTLSYLGNKKWSFTHSGDNTRAVIRFTLTHIVGYLFNIMLLYVLVDTYDYSHQYVQLLAIAILVFYFFFALKYFVFSSTQQSERH